MSENETDVKSEKQDTKVVDEKSKTEVVKESDNDGLYSALKSERENRKTLEKELKDVLKEKEDVQTKLSEIEAKFETTSESLRKFEIKEKKSSLLNEIVEKQEEVSIDKKKAEKFLDKLVYESDEKLVKDIEDIVDILSVPKIEETEKKERILSGQPSKAQSLEVGEEVHLGKLYRENPEAYKEYVKQKRKNNPFARKQ